MNGEPGEATWRTLSELQVLVMAIGAAAVCWWPLPLSIELSVGALAVAAAARQPRLVIVAVVAVASARAAGSAASHLDLPAQRWEGPIQLVTDPEESRFGWVAEGRLLAGEEAGARVRLNLPWEMGGELRNVGAGHEFHFSGSLHSVEQTSFTRARHLRGRLSVDSGHLLGGPPAWQIPSEWFRDAVRAGADAMPERLRPLYLGLVIGDDRTQPLSQQAEFRAAGLSHLLAVSGQNVAFVLAVFTPLARRLGRRSGVGLTVAILVVFALATRLEPSVMRATVSAGIAAVAVVSGRRSAGARTLGLTVTTLLIVDPFLARSIGFALSVLASLGILLAGPSIVRRVPGPTALAEAVGITVSAQLFVAPLLIVIFGPISVVSLPANVLAGWAAGAVMTWGLTGGLVAGLVPQSISTVLSLPASGLVWWIDAVAGWAVDLPLPRVGGVGVVAGGALLVAWHLTARRIARWSVVAALMVMGWNAVPRPSEPTALAGGLWWPATVTTGSVLVVSARADPGLIADTVDRRITRVDVVVVERGNRSIARLVAELGAVADLGEIWAPPQHRVRRGRRLAADQTLEVSNATLVIRVGRDQLDITVQPDTG